VADAAFLTASEHPKASATARQQREALQQLKKPLMRRTF
jgi:hypothetical protein